jgi:hypothetical protein
MDVCPQVIVEPPSSRGGRRVTISMEIVGHAYSLPELAKFLQRARLYLLRASLDLQQYGPANTPPIECRGGEPGQRHPDGQPARWE